LKQASFRALAFLLQKSDGTPSEPTQNAFWIHAQVIQHRFRNCKRAQTQKTLKRNSG